MGRQLELCIHSFDLRKDLSLALLLLQPLLHGLGDGGVSVLLRGDLRLLLPLLHGLGDGDVCVLLRGGLDLLMLEELL